MPSQKKAKAKAGLLAWSVPLQARRLVDDLVPEEAAAGRLKRLAQGLVESGALR